jgi:uncharacterized protein (TIGR02646 family)
MHPWTRPAEPAELQNKRSELTLNFIKERKQTGKTPACSWPKVTNADGEIETLQTLLARSTIQHCNYCDNRMGYSSRDTIDHFLPKKHFSHQAYAWRNLYLCCDGCQRKGTKYHYQVLRPDTADYSFSRYFRYKRNGELAVIADEGPDRVRAEKTIEILDLNDDVLVSDRMLAFNQHSKPRQRPVPPGLDPQTALRRAEMLKASYDDKPFRCFFSQENC